MSCGRGADLLAELINLIAQPYAFDRFCCRVE